MNTCIVKKSSMIRKITVELGNNTRAAKRRANFLNKIGCNTQKNLLVNKLTIKSERKNKINADLFLNSQ